MKLTILKVVWKFATKGVDGLVKMGFDAVNAALANIKGGTKDKVQAALNVAQKVISILYSFKWACPTKWQTAYVAVLDCMVDVAAALDDLTITEDEANNLMYKVREAYKAWDSEDDETCKE